MRKTIIIDCGSTKVPEIEKIISNLGTEFTTIKLKELTSIKDFNCIIISGAPILLTEINYDIYLEKAKIIFSNNSIPILGICFGHQLMGLYYKASVSKCNESRTWEEINFTAKFDLLQGEPKKIMFFQDHCECITCPDEFISFASSNTCNNEAMKHKSNPWYGVQFHPEVSGPIGQELIANFIALRSEK